MKTRFQVIRPQSRPVRRDESPGLQDTVLRVMRLSFAAFLVILFFSSSIEWNGNGLHYFSQALYSKPANSGIFAAGWSNPTTLLFQSSTRLLVMLVGLQTAWVALNFLGFLMLAVGLGLLADSVKMSTPAVVVGLVAFFSLGQSYFAGEWIFLTYEAKVPAYAFGFAAIATALRRAPILPWVFGLVAVLWHPLVGIPFLALVVFGTDWSSPTHRRRSVVTATVLIVSSVLYVVALRAMTMGNDNQSNLDARQIYSLGRVPHHVAPFGGEAAELGIGPIPGWFEWGLLLTPLLFCAGLGLSLAFGARGQFRRLVSLALLSHLWIPLAFLVAYLDSKTQYLGTLFLFRPISTILLLACLALSATIFNESRAWFQAVLAIGFAWIVAGQPTVALVLPGNLESIKNEGNEVRSFISQEIGASETVLVDFDSVGSNTGFTEENFELLTGRGQVATWKFVPTKSVDIVEWWALLDSKESVLEHRCESGMIKHWDYVLSGTGRLGIEDAPAPVAAFESTAIYRVDDRFEDWWCAR